MSSAIRSPVITIHPDPPLLLQNCQKEGCNQSLCANFSEQSYTSYRKKPNNFPKVRQYGLKLAGETPIPQNCKIPWHTLVALCSLTTWIKALTPSGTPKRCTFSVIDLMFSSSLARSCWIFRSSFLLAPPSTHTRLPAFSFPLPGPTSNAKGMKASSQGTRGSTHQEPIQRVPKEKQSCTWDVQTVFQKKTPK